MDEQFEFKVIGSDEQGNPLYQKVYKTDQQNNTSKPPVSRKEAIAKTLADNGNTIYKGLSPELISVNHQESIEQYPNIAFRDKEFVIKVINRHPIGLYLIWTIAGIISLLMLVVWSIVFYSSDSVFAGMAKSRLSTIVTMSSIIFFSIVAITVLFAYIATRVYRANKMVVTTERVVQYKSASLFDRKKQTIDLGWIEDVSSHKRGFFAMMFNFGSVRLSTIGDESTYYFKYARNPAEISSQLNELILAVKNEDSLPNLYD